MKIGLINKNLRQLAIFLRKEIIFYYVKTSCLDEVAKTKQTKKKTPELDLKPICKWLDVLLSLTLNLGKPLIR